MQFSLSVLQQLVVTSMCRGLVVCLWLLMQRWQWCCGEDLWAPAQDAQRCDWSRPRPWPTTSQRCQSRLISFLHTCINEFIECQKSWNEPDAGTGWQWKQTGRYGISAAFKVDSSSLEWMCAGWEFHVGVNNCLECWNTVWWMSGMKSSF